jgi:cysteinyl-tRNA synthetase
MSKSLGNVFTLSDLKQRGVHPLAFRYWLLTSHYRSPANFTWEAVIGAQTALEKLTASYSELPDAGGSGELISEFEKAISDDLNTPIAIALLQKAKSKSDIDKMDEVLGLSIGRLSEGMKKIPDEILEIKKERDAARQSKDFAKSDELRKKIEGTGYILEDKPGQSLIRKKLAP